MQTFKASELKTFEQIVGLKQNALKRVMSSFLKKHYPKVIETKDYIFCEGTIPIGLVAHMDTVFDKPAKEVFFDQKRNVMWSPQGLGADDRAGVFAIIKIVQSGLRPHIILTTDEEKGCLGATVLGGLDCPFSDLRYLIELDRRNSDDCVFYDCVNEDFIKYVEGFGFVEAWGSYSDICCLCEPWGIAGVNLSVGYRDEHSEIEVLFVGQLFNTIEKVKTMLTETDIPSFEYIGSPYSYPYGGWDANVWNAAYGYGSYSSKVVKCGKCGKYHMEEELFPVLLQNGQSTAYCPNCIAEVSWCTNCYSAYEKYSPEAPITGLCPKCAESKVKKNADSGNKETV